MKKGKNPLSLKRSSVLLVKGFVSQEGYYILVIMEKMKEHSSERDSMANSAICNLSPHHGVDEGR